MRGRRLPWIGISTYREQASWGVWQQEAAVLPATYVDCVAAAGGIPLLLPPLGDINLVVDSVSENLVPEKFADRSDASYVAELAVETVSGLDGLVISGGPDVDPAHYGSSPHPETGAPRAQRDAWELALLSAALERDVPVLGICRGAQLFNVVRGGTLVQHLPEQPGAEDHRGGVAVYRGMPVALEPEALPGSVLGSSVTVSCYHHQALDRLGEGLSVTGRAADGTIEAVVAVDRRFAVGVQWHPEQDRELRLFAALVEAAARVGLSEKVPVQP